MQTIISSFTPDHLKLMLCLVLAVLSFMKLSEIHDNKTGIKNKTQLKVNQPNSHKEQKKNNQGMKAEGKDINIQENISNKKQQEYVDERERELREKIKTIPTSNITLKEYIQNVYKLKVQPNLGPIFIYKNKKQVQELKQHQMDIQNNEFQQNFEGMRQQNEQNKFMTPKYHKIHDINLMGSCEATPTTHYSNKSIKTQRKIKYFENGEQNIKKQKPITKERLKNSKQKKKINTIKKKRLRPQLFRLFKQKNKNTNQKEIKNNSI